MFYKKVSIAIVLLLSAQYGIVYPMDNYDIKRKEMLSKPPWAYIFDFETDVSPGVNRVVILWERRITYAYLDQFLNFLMNDALWNESESKKKGTSSHCASKACSVSLSIETSMTKEQLQSLIDKANKHFTDSTISYGVFQEILLKMPEAINFLASGTDPFVGTVESNPLRWIIYNATSPQLDFINRAYKAMIANEEFSIVPQSEDEKVMLSLPEHVRIYLLEHLKINGIKRRDQ